MNYLKEKLKEKHMTQTELANRCGVGKACICNIIATRNKPHLELLYNIAIVLDLDLKEFIEEILK